MYTSLYNDMLLYYYSVEYRDWLTDVRLNLNKMGNVLEAKNVINPT